MKVLEGNLVAQNIKVALVAARFNEFIVSKLISGAVDGLKRHNVAEDDITLAWVPGALLKFIISIADKAQSYPLFPAFVPALSIGSTTLW